MNIKNIIGLVIFAAILGSCDYQKQNKALKEDKSLAQKDLREGDELVYGVHPDSAARQTKLTYATKPEYTERAEKIRVKLESQK
jgi:hypothetical protein